MNDNRQLVVRRAGAVAPAGAAAGALGVAQGARFLNNPVNRALAREVARHVGRNALSSARQVARELRERYDEWRDRQPERGAANIGQKRTRASEPVRNVQKKVVMNKQYMNHAYTPSVIKRKAKKRKKSKKSSALSKRQKRSVRAIANAMRYQLALSKQRYGFGAGLYVGYGRTRHYVNAINDANELDNFTWGVRDPQSATGGSKIQKIDVTTAGLNQKVKFNVKRIETVSNNSNAQGRIDAYLYYCNEYTNDNPNVELLRMYNAQYGTALTTLEFEHEIFDSIPGQKRKIWTLVSKQVAELKGGEQTQFVFDPKPTIYNVDRYIREGKPNYVPGSYCIIYRMVGRHTHLNVETTPSVIGLHPGLYAHPCTEFFSVDQQVKEYTQVYVWGAGDIVSQYETDTTGLVYPASLTQYAVSADPEAPQVAAPEQT